MSLQKGLVGHWTMDDDDISGSVCSSSSGNRISTSVSGNPSTAKSGVVGESVRFDSDDRYEASGSALNIDGSSFSICAWAYPTDFSGGTRYIFGKGDTNATDQNLHFGFRSGGTITLAFYADDLNYTDTTYSTNNWYHVCGTYDSSSNEQVLYLDGNRVASRTSDGDLTNTNGLDLRIAEALGGYLNGRVDDARIYTRQLSDSEINALYQMRSQRLANINTNVRYNDTQGWYDSNGHPSTKSELDEFFNTSNSGVTNILDVEHKRDHINHGLEGQNSTFGTVNGEPKYFTEVNGYAWKLEGRWTAPESGTYTFGIDADDAADILIDGSQVVGWYGGHGFNGDIANHEATINLDARQRYDIAFRYEEGGGGSGLVVGYQKPSDSSYIKFPVSEVF